MSCLALSLQPANGSDILLQTREWFPPARALFTDSDPSVDSIGDDPLAASSGQLIVGVESRYRVVYRLVNSIYVLGITTADHDNAINVFECIHVVNQAVSVIVTACRGVDVTPEKLGRKYAEIYMALDIVLRGVSNIRLAAMLASLHGDSIAKMVHSALDSENKIRGADNWTSVEVNSVKHSANIEVFSHASFEMPPETIAAGDEIAATIAPALPTEQLQDQKEEIEEIEAEKDPFAASDKINEPAELVGGFKKNRDPSATDLTKALAGLEVTTLPPAEATQSTHIAVEGFEGEYGGIEFGNEQASLGETFEGFSDAWGGGLDPSEFVGPTKGPKTQGLGGLELLQTGPDNAPKVDNAAATGGTGTPLDELVKSTEMKGPEMYISEQINVEFRESLLARVGLMGTVYLKTLPTKTSGDKETEFSFRVEGTTAVKRFVIQSSRVSSLGNGMFHVRTAASDEPLPVLKYSLVPRLTPLPLRIRLIKRFTGTLLSLMIQYVSNPELPVPLNDVTFVLKLPVDPSLLQVSPKAMLNRSEKELKWHIAEIPQKGSPGRLRARMPVDLNDGDEEMDIVVYVKFSIQGKQSLSGVCLRPATEGKTDFYEGNHRTKDSSSGGVVARNERRELLFASTKLYKAESPPIAAELGAIRDGLQDGLQWRLWRFTVESDCLEAVKMVHENEVSGRANKSISNGDTH
uniref:MHD domain-containing protein n=1 Tax=Cannabis sativa TaxID=3483 RepID=A0A803QA22_CANSA